MSRTLTAAMLTAIAAQEGYADVLLLELNSSAGALRYCDKAQAVSWDGQTWAGIGGVMSFSPPPETTDLAAQSMQLSLSGVDTGVISTVLGDDVRGREAKLTWGQIDLSTGAVVLDPIELFDGLLNDQWHISHDQDGDGPGGVSIRTVVTAKLARALPTRQVRTNVVSHDAMLDRAGLTVGDRLFEFVPTLANKVILWGGRRIGTTGPDRRGGSGDEGGGGEVVW